MSSTPYQTVGILEEDDFGSSIFVPSAEAVPQLPDVSPSSLFTEPLNINNPWDPPTGFVDVSTVLADVALPDIYSKAFMLANPVGGSVSMTSLNKILKISGLPHGTVEKIINLAVPATNTRINRGEFNVALALVALAQKNMGVSIENLMARKQDLPEPSLPNLESLSFSSRTLSFSSIGMQRTPTTSGLDDPWATPTPTTNGVNSPGYSSVTDSNMFVPPVQSGTSTGRATATAPGVAVTEGEFQWLSDTDRITVNFAPEREGFLFLKHVNYIVESPRHGSRVVRRYSDFWWLMECLVKRYPFRILPALPPKKIGVDESFLEKRRKGLMRFLNFIVRHPVLKEDDLFEMFITEQTEIAVWRRNNTPSLDEEYIKKVLTPEMERRIPGDLDERLERVHKRLDNLIDHYRTMCNLFERMARREEGMATDLTRYSLALNSLVEADKGCSNNECYPCSQVTIGLEQISTHMQKASAVLEEESAAMIDTVLENLKSYRDLLVSFRETLERKERLGTDNTESLNTRITANQAKLMPLTGKEGSDPEVDRLSAAIEKDQQDIELQKRRNQFIRHCLNAELTLFHKSSAFVSLLYQKFVGQQAKFLSKLHENWKALGPSVCAMPNDSQSFS